MSAVDGLGVLASLVALIAAAAAGYRYATTVYRRTLGSRRILTEALNRIGPGVTTAHVQGLLGPPVYTRKALSREAGPGPTLAESYESIYFTRHAYVQIIHDEEGEVLAFGVTTVDPKFNPVLRLVPPDANGPIRIGRTRFAEVHNRPMAIWYATGNKRSHYSEIYTYGGMGGTFGFARNEAGIGAYGQLETINELDGSGNPTLPDEERDALERFRATTVINTVVVYSEKVPFAIHGYSMSWFPWRVGIDPQSTPDLLQKHRTVSARIRDWIRPPRS